MDNLRSLEFNPIPLRFQSNDLINCINVKQTRLIESEMAERIETRRCVFIPVCVSL